MLYRIVLTGLALCTAVHPQTLLVLNKDEATLSFIDARSGQTGAQVPVGQGPHELVASTDGKLAFAANYGTGPAPGSTISVIDVTARKELRRLELGVLRRPHGLAFAAGKLYFTAEGNRVLGRYDPATNQVDGIVGTGQAGTHMIIATPDAKLLITANIGSDNLTFIDGANQTVVPVGKGPEGIDLSADGKTVWAAHSRDGGVSVIDVASRKVVHTADAGTKRSNRIKVTADGKLALISDLEAGDLVVMDAGTRTVTKRLKLGRAPEGILLPPGTGEAWVAVSGDDHIAVVSLASLTVTRKIATGKGPDGMAWIP